MFGAYTFSSVDNPKTHLQAFYHLAFMEIFTESIWVKVQQDSWTAFRVFKKKKGGVGVDGLMKEEWGSILSYCKNSFKV